MLANTQNSIIINKGKDLKISKNRFNGYGRQAGCQTREKNISTIWIVGNLMALQTEMAVNVQKSLETIFIQEFLMVENQND